MAFPIAQAHSVLTAADMNTLFGFFNGLSGYPANPLLLITPNDSNNPVLTLKNLDQTNGQVALFLKADGTVLMNVDKNGFRYSPDGVVQNLTPVSLSGAETITGAKVFAGGVTMTGPMAWHRSTPVASAATLTLPTDGNIIPVTGTVTITAIPVAQTPVILEFASSGCKVTAGATLLLEGDFVSGAAGSTLMVNWNGAAWEEVARSRALKQTVLAHATGQTLTNAYAVITLTTPDNTAAGGFNHYGMVVGNTFVAPWSGIYHLNGNFETAQGNAGSRSLQIFKNTVSFAGVAQIQGPDVSADGYGSWSMPIYLTAGDVVDFRGKSTNNNFALRSTSWFGMEYRGLA